MQSKNQATVVATTVTGVLAASCVMIIIAEWIIGKPPSEIDRIIAFIFFAENAVRAAYHLAINE